MSETIPTHAGNPRPIGIRDAALGALMLLLLLLFYSPAISGGLVFDDDRYITPEGLRSLHGLWRIWFEPGAAFQYYPVLHTAFWIEHLLWGDAVRGYHLVNIFQHAVSCCLVVVIMRKLSLPGAWLAAFIFALHPVCVESVAWISEQKNTLSTVFYLGALLAYLQFDGDRRKRWYLAACAFFLLALLSKTVTATLPGTILVILWWQKGRLDWKRDLPPLLPWLAIGAAGGIASGWIERKDFDARSADFSLTLLEHCLLACRVLWFYFVKLFWPADLMFNYPRWQVSASAWWQWMFLLGVVAVAAGLCLLARRHRGPLAAFLLFAGNLFPVLGFFYIGWFSFSFVADHFQYVACLAIFVPLASGLALAVRKIPVAGLRWTIWGTAGIILLALSSLTWLQSHAYIDMETFYQKALEGNPDGSMTHFNYGLVLHKIPGRLTESMGEFEEALRLKPGDENLKNMVGTFFLNTPGRLPEAVSTFQDSVRIEPDDPGAHFLLGRALCGTPGRLNDATAEFETAVRLKPDFAEARYMLGNALSLTPGRKDEAIAQYEEALRILRLRPDVVDTHYMLGNVLAALPGRRQEAIVQYEEALRLKPDMQEARQALLQLQQSENESGK